jgi:ubiquinone/menaquinone biosynthesis C-methylase UbiE
MLTIARHRATSLGLDADLREGDAEHLPFGDASFDTAVCALSLCAIPRPAAAIAEIRRVLVPGGRLLLLDHIGSTWPPVKSRAAIPWPGLAGAPCPDDCRPR